MPGRSRPSPTPLPGLIAFSDHTMLDSLGEARWVPDGRAVLALIFFLSKLLFQAYF